LLICAFATILMLATLVGGDWLPVKVIALSAYSLAVVLAFAALARNLILRGLSDLPLKPPKSREP